jgi:predicted nucleic acid-binding protein
VIYVDTSVALAHLLAEDVHPPAWLWDESLVSSRLLEYELWTRLHARDLGATHGEAARELVGRLALVELAPPVLARALEPFPAPARTLDALHLAAVRFLLAHGQLVRLATYDDRQARAARAMGVELVDLEEPPSA